MREHQNNRAHKDVAVVGALLRMGDHRLRKRVMSGELRNTAKRGPGGKRKNGRTAGQRIFGYLVSRGTGAPPHFTLGSGITQYVKEEENASEHR